MADKTETRLKRSRKIDKLMARPEFIDHWAVKWGDLLQVNRARLGDKGMWAFREWIRESIGSEQALRQDGARADHGARQHVPESAGQLFPLHARSQGGDGDHHAAFPGRAHGLRAVPRPSLREVDAEPVFPVDRVLRRGGHQGRAGQQRGNHLRQARRHRDPPSQGQSRDVRRSSSSAARTSSRRRRICARRWPTG